ncbi:proline-rich receptor-like protein kinase PERK2, partial [Homalodisca vitripennis]|uniref:proline-rich receptor-like protein kinase PERK2 n=1 Tax=Homalodisca vitripennis TaxID=197043 RepID=UPI001EEA60CB
CEVKLCFVLFSFLSVESNISLLVPFYSVRPSHQKTQTRQPARQTAKKPTAPTDPDPMQDSPEKIPDPDQTEPEPPDQHSSLPPSPPRTQTDRIPRTQRPQKPTPDTMTPRRHRKTLTPRQPPQSRQTDPPAQSHQTSPPPQNPRPARRSPESQTADPRIELRKV